MILLIFNFTTRFTKIFRRLSIAAKSDVRDRISRLVVSLVSIAIRYCRRHQSTRHPIIWPILAVIRPLDILLGLYLLLKLYTDILFSEFSDVSRLLYHQNKIDDH